MKSIMHEASSIAKAIEQGWVKAGSPADFSVKVLELPTKNFFGMTVNPAKIALYFDEKSTTNHRQEPYSVASQQKAPARRRPDTREQRQPQQPIRRQESPQRQERPERVERAERVNPEAFSSAASAEQQQAPARQPLEAQWNDAMMRYSEEWLQQVLKGLERDVITFTVEPNNLYLRITLQQPILPDPEKEKRLLASLALLLLEALKRNFRAGLRRHKIILTHQ